MLVVEPNSKEKMRSETPKINLLQLRSFFITVFFVTFWLSCQDKKDGLGLRNWPLTRLGSPRDPLVFVLLSTLL